ncbi:MAG: 3'(2'),5'-bisphosphate nucleotidase CysQ, partial [Verrucomicrobiota bacterium]
LTAAVDCALRAGAAIMSVYRTDFSVETKADQSPLTKADMAAHNIIKTALEDAFCFPVLSEEDCDIAYEQRRAWRTFWLVDPLDGTKEFIRKNGEFTVNIALVEDSVPTLGVVFAPARKILYFASPETGARRIREVETDGVVDVARLLLCAEAIPVETAAAGLRVVASRSHSNEETESFIARLEEKYGSAERVSVGSSLKLCLVAEGAADAYPRIAPTMEWDTAAADAVVRATGGRVVNHADGTPLKYNKPDLTNPHFVVYNQRLKNA